MKSILKISALSLLSFSFSMVAMNTMEGLQKFFPGPEKISFSELEIQTKGIIGYLVAKKMQKNIHVTANDFCTLAFPGAGIKDLRKHIIQVHTALNKDQTIGVFSQGDLKDYEITSVDLTSNSLQEIPESLGFLSKTVTDLNVTDNKFKNIGSIVALFRNLKQLNISKNPGIEVYSEDLKQLTQLETLATTKDAVMPITFSYESKKEHSIYSSSASDASVTYQLKK